MFPNSYSIDLAFMQLEELEKKISEELDDITEKLATLETDLVRFADIKQLRQEAESNRNNLVMEQQATSEAKDDLLSQVNDLESQNEALQVYAYEFSI